MNESKILPRFIRATKAPAYLGMNKNLFAKLVKPSLTVITISKQGRCYDRLDLDAWANDYKSRNGRPPEKLKGGPQWQDESRQGSRSVTISGTSTRKSGVLVDFAKALTAANSKKRSST